MTIPAHLYQNVPEMIRHALSGIPDGPWSVRPYVDGGDGRVVRIGGPNGCDAIRVAPAYAWSSTGSFAITPEVALKVANLIADAPQLLAIARARILQLEAEQKKQRVHHGLELEELDEKLAAARRRGRYTEDDY